jgi:alkylhydroperoxidase family enzyme
MPRIPYRDENDPKIADVVRLIRERRGGTLLNLDRMLIHSPNFARGWNSLLGAVRRELTLDAKSRELAICAVAKINKADYEWDHHLPHLLAAGGTQQQVDALNASLDDASANSALFDENEPRGAAPRDRDDPLRRGSRRDPGACAKSLRRQGLGGPGRHRRRIQHGVALPGGARS